MAMTAGTRGLGECIVNNHNFARAGRAHRSASVQASTSVLHTGRAVLPGGRDLFQFVSQESGVRRLARGRATARRSSFTPRDRAGTGATRATFLDVRVFRLPAWPSSRPKRPIPSAQKCSATAISPRRPGMCAYSISTLRPRDNQSASYGRFPMSNVFPKAGRSNGEIAAAGIPSATALNRAAARLATL